MKKIRVIILMLAMTASVMACEKSLKDIPDQDETVEQDTTKTADPEPDPNPGTTVTLDYPGREIPTINDMVLLYGGSHHRSPYTWSTEYLTDYVRYVDSTGVHHWLFDGFLCLEFMWVNDPGGTANKTYITGYKYNNEYLPAAEKSDWERLADFYFQNGVNLDAIEQAIKNETASAGTPSCKRKIVIGIPEPIRYKYPGSSSGGSDYWGELDGTNLDFSKSTDRVKAVEWYIDRCRASFLAKKYQYIELAGFYWVAETATQSRSILNSISGYVKKLGYSFNWIPYYSADGYSAWRDFGFTQAYLQPNYFFNESVPYSRLADAIKAANSAGMGLEMEFDGNALTANGRAYRLTDYITVFKENGVWESLPLAYYQGSWALRGLKYSKTAEDVALYNKFCEFVISRPVRLL